MIYADRARALRLFAAEIRPLLVDRHGDDLDARVLKGTARRRVSRVFKPDRVATLQQCVRAKPQGLLCAVEDDDLAFRAPDATGCPEVSGDLKSQVFVPTWIVVATINPGRRQDAPAHSDAEATQQMLVHMGAPERERRQTERFGLERRF